MRTHAWTRLLLASCLTLATACGTSARQLPAGFEGDECLCVALGVDYMHGVGSATAIGLPSLRTQLNVAAGGVSGDPVLRYYDGKFYIVNRLAANLTVVDASTLLVDQQFSVGSDVSNAYDVAVDGRAAWVVYFGEPAVRVFDLDDPAAQPVQITLPTTATDVDQNPEAASIAIVGGKAYVSLQHLEMFMPAANGQIVVIDTASRTVETTIDLPEKNPVNFLRADGAKLYVGATPDFSNNMTGCLARIATGDSPSADCMTSAVSMGGYVNGIAPAGDGSLFVATAQSFTEGKVVRVAADGSVDAQAYTAAGQLPTDVAACGKYLVANDTSAGGLRVYDTSTRTELTTAALSVGEPPAFASGIACFSR